MIKPVTNVMEQRRQMIEGQMADAKKTTEQANEHKSQYEDALKQAHDESAHIEEKARKTAQAEYESRVNAADQEAEKIIANAHKTIDLEREKTVQDLQTQIAGLAMTAAAKIVAEQAGYYQALYEKFLEEVGEAHEDREDK